MSLERIWENMIYPDGKTVYPNQEQWDKWRREIHTEVGGLSAGFRSEILLRGYKVINDMTGKISFIQALVLAITGRLPDKNETRLLDALIINTALADPRFWFNRVARLSATVRCPPVASLAAGMLTYEGDFFSSGPAYNTSKFFYYANKKDTAALEDIVREILEKKEILTGYGRVLARGPDERNEALLKVAEECGFGNGEHLKIAYHVEALLQKLKSPDLYLNGGGIRCAMLLDMGFLPHQAALYYSMMLIIGQIGNIAEAYEKPPCEFLPLSDDDIEYIGPAKRNLPPASEKQTIVHQTEQGRIVVMDSISFIEMANRGDVIVCGSHGGIPAAEYGLNCYPSGIFFNDAGKGKDDAGVRGLELFEYAGIPAAAVAADSARIGNGMDTYNEGIISVLNNPAFEIGVREGSSVREACLIMLNVL